MVDVRRRIGKNWDGEKVEFGLGMEIPKQKFWLYFHIIGSWNISKMKKRIRI